MEVEKIAVSRETVRRQLRALVERHGVPLSLYRDQQGTFQRNDKHWTIEEQMAGRQTLTQLGRVLEELGIQSIRALSPQAKGRIERLWKTFARRQTIPAWRKNLNWDRQLVCAMSGWWAKLM